MKTLCLGYQTSPLSWEIKYISFPNILGSSSEVWQERLPGVSKELAQSGAGRGGFVFLRLSSLEGCLVGEALRLGL